MVGGQLPGRPRRDRVAHIVSVAAGQCHEFPVRIAADPGDPVPEPEQAVEHLDRLRTCGDVTGEHDAFGVPDGGFGEDRVERGQHAVNVGKHDDRSGHQNSLARCPRGRQGVSLPA